MNTDAKPLATYRNFRGWLALVLALLLLAFFALNHALKPRQVSRLLLDRAGKALGLEITASGNAEYQLMGTPTLVLRDLVAREPGADTTLLRAKRLYISLPWSTLRTRGSQLVATRIELDTPVLDLPALQHWLATRPPSEKRLPTIDKGLRIRGGSIVNGDASTNSWRIVDIDLDLPRMAPGQPLHARMRGRYLAPPLEIPVDLAVAIMHPGALVDGKTSGFAAAGTINIKRDGDWQLPSTVILSGPLSIAADGLQVTPARLGAVARFDSGDTRLPFSFGMHGPLRFAEPTWTLAPTSLVLRGRGTDPATDPIPTLDARGTLALGHQLALQLDGTLARWPAAWPALPPPISQSTSALPFALHYAGTPDLSQVARLQLRRDDSRFDGRFRLQDISRWISDDKTHSPLPPLDGKLVTPRLEISGAQLQGVEVIIDDPTVSATNEADDAPHARP